MNDALIPARWLPVSRAVWLAFVFLSLVIFIASIPPYFNELRVACSAADCHMFALSPQEIQLLRNFGLSVEFYAGYQVALDFYVLILLIPLSGLIFWHRSDSWVGFLLSFTLVSFGTVSSLGTMSLMRLYPSLSWPLFLLDTFAAWLFVLLFFLFPDGRFVPRWTWLLMIAVLGAILVDLLLPLDGPPTPSLGLGVNILWLSCLIVGVLAQIYRYRWVSTPTQRQQTKWIMFGLIIMVILTLIWTILVEIFPLQSGSARLVLNFSWGIQLLLFTIFPLSVAFSILRYRLWDIDIIINLTLVYGLLTGVLGLLYFGSVLLLQSLFRALSGQSSQLAVVASTLAIAALFNPLRRHIQHGIDSRFYRRKYDAEKTLSAFAATLREEVDLDKLREALLAVMEKTTQPVHMSLWLAESEQQDAALDDRQSLS